MNICMETMGVWNAIILYRKYRNMVWNPLFCVWFGFGNSQNHFLLGLS